MNEWKKVSEELPPLYTPVWAGWFEDGNFISGLFFTVDDFDRVIWCLCDDSISYDNFGIWNGDDDYPVSHWLHLPKPPKE